MGNSRTDLTPDSRNSTAEHSLVRGLDEDCRQPTNSPTSSLRKTGETGRGTFKLIESEPLRTGFGEDLCRKIFGSPSPSTPRPPV